MLETIVHPISDIDGIGPVLASHLETAGYPFAESLLKFSPLSVAQDLEPIDGISLDNALIDFIPQAALFRLRDMPVEVRQFLHHRRIYYARLAYGDAKGFQQRLSSSGLNATIEAIQSWQLQASRLLNKSMLTLVIQSDDGTPVQGADVFLADPPKTGDGIVWHWQTQANGFAIVDHLEAGLHEIVVVHDDKYACANISVGFNERLCLELRLEQDAPQGVILDERVDGIQSKRRPLLRRTFDSPTEFPNGELMEVTSVTDDSVRLSSVFRKQIGASWLVESVRVPTDMLPTAAVTGALFEWNGSTFNQRTGSSDRVRRNLRLAPIIAPFTHDNPGEN